MCVLELHLNFSRWLDYSLNGRSKCGRWLWCRVAWLVKIRATDFKCRNSFHISVGYFWYAIRSRGPSVEKIDSPILSTRALILEQHKNGLRTEMLWVPLGREGVLPRSKVTQKLRSDPIYEFHGSVICVRVFSKIWYVDYDILIEIPNSTKKSSKIDSDITRKHRRNSRTRITVTHEYLWKCESEWARLWRLHTYSGVRPESGQKYLKSPKIGNPPINDIVISPNPHALANTTWIG